MMDPWFCCLYSVVLRLSMHVFLRHVGSAADTHMYI